MTLVAFFPVIFNKGESNTNGGSCHEVCKNLYPSRDSLRHHDRSCTIRSRAGTIKSVAFSILIPARCCVEVVFYPYCNLMRPLFGDMNEQEFSVWFKKALVLLVVACPCALVIATPITTVSSIGAAAMRGVLIKNGDTLEKLRNVSRVGMDKTGTITQGRCRVTHEYKVDINDQLSLQLAASVEVLSTHPLAMAIVNHATGCITNAVVRMCISRGREDRSYVCAYLCG